MDCTDQESDAACPTPVTMPSASRAELTSARKRPKTEKRAQQNRAAQRRYREKLKLRQTQLESFAATHGFKPDAASEGADEPASQGLATPSICGSPYGRQPGSLDELNHSQPASINGDVSGEDSDSVLGLHPLRDFANVGSVSETAYPDFMTRDPADLVSFLEDDCFPHDLALDKDKILAEYDLRALTTTNHKLSSNKRLLLEHCFHVLGLNQRDTNSDLVKLAFGQGLNIRRLCLKGIQTILSQDQDMNKRMQCYPGLANPYANCLRFKRFATLDAFLSNALALGFHIPDLYRLGVPSPFYRPEIKSVADISGPLAGYFMKMPPNLRPTSLQIMRRHKPWLDLLPFPRLRMRILIAIGAETPLCDEWDLKHDIIHDGLICYSAGRPSSGHPWDMRSWEVAPWFMRKWGAVLFGEEHDKLLAQGVGR